LPLEAISFSDGSEIGETMWVKTTRWLLAALAAVLLFGGSCLGQNAGSITGTVKDSNGGAIAGASVTLTNPANSVTQSATTNEAGLFVSGSCLPEATSYASASRASGRWRRRT
jgi:hypothetical protein